MSRNINPFRRRALQRDIDEELRFHFDARIDELVGQGMSRDAAHAQANAEFGNVEDVRSDLHEIDDRVARRRHRGEVLDVLRSDVVYSIRSLWRTPVVSLTIIVTLALGIGLNATMFSFLDVVFLRPPAGVVAPSEIRRLWGERVRQSSKASYMHFAYAAYPAVQASLGNRAQLAIYAGPDKTAIGTAEGAPTAKVVTASATYFTVLGVKAALGRVFGPDEDQLTGGAPVAVLSDAFWRRHFNGEASALGKTIQLGKQTLTVIGVLPPGFAGVDLDAADVWYPLTTGATDPFPPTPWYRDPNVNGFFILMRVAPGAIDKELEQRATRAVRAPGVTYEWDSTMVAQLGPIAAARGPGEIASEVQVATRLAGVAFIVLLIAIANVVNLLLARAIRRRREIAVRLALGISRSRLVRLLVTESALLAVAAAIAALAAASWGGAVIRTFLMPGIAWSGSALDWRVTLFGVGIAMAAGVAAGLIPALQSRAPDLTSALKAGSRELGAHRSRLRAMLIVVQAALSVVLLVGAALFVQSLRNAHHRDIGYTVDRLAFIGVSGFSRDTARNADRAARLRALELRLASVPGVEGVTFTSMRPKYGMMFVSYFPDADTVAHKKPEGMWTGVSPNYFSTVGMRLLRGRTFAPAAADAEPTVMVNQAMADALWPGEDPLKHCIRLRKPSEPCAPVIGVAQTAMLDALREKPMPHIFVPIDHGPLKDVIRDVVIRIDPERITTALTNVRAILKAEFPASVLTPNTMVKAMEREYRPFRLGATLFLLFGGLAALVAAIGIFSTVSYAVSQRTHEFGIRAALGADMSAILRQVLGEGLRTVAVGVALGIVLAVAAGRLVASLLFGVSPGNPIAIAVAGAALLAIAAVASFVPAMRAAKSDPVAALRSE